MWRLNKLCFALPVCFCLCQFLCSQEIQTPRILEHSAYAEGLGTSFYYSFNYRLTVNLRDSKVHIPLEIGTSAFPLYRGRSMGTLPIRAGFMIGNKFRAGLMATYQPYWIWAPVNGQKINSFSTIIPEVAIEWQFKRPVYFMGFKTSLFINHKDSDHYGFYYLYLSDIAAAYHSTSLSDVNFFAYPSIYFGYTFPPHSRNLKLKE